MNVSSVETWRVGPSMGAPGELDELDKSNETRSGERAEANGELGKSRAGNRVSTQTS